MTTKSSKETRETVRSEYGSVSVSALVIDGVPKYFELSWPKGNGDGWYEYYIDDCQKVVPNLYKALSDVMEHLGLEKG